MSSPRDFGEVLSDDRFEGQVIHLHETPPRPARYATPTAKMQPQLVERLKVLGLDQLYSHQAAAFDAAAAGHDVLAITGTNSGKTLTYNLPAMQYALTEPAARMLYLFPTKALAQDQLGRLEMLGSTLGLRAGTYDGDTPQTQRASIRKLANAVLTNPDMLHVGILPGHENWTRFFKSLRLIVIDELHVYRGVFGSNVGGIIRRLLRLCEWHRSRPQIIACSATIGNPAELFQKLTGRTPHVIDDDGSPQGRRTFAFFNPPEAKHGRHMSPNFSTGEVLSTFAQSGLRSMAFNRSRVAAELVLRYARQRLKETDVDPAKIESYRAGYTVKERRGIEKDLHSGRLLGLSATNAMELGVDIGGLDAVVMNGYPGTIASFFQQAGRAGRGTKNSLAVMIAHDDPLEQYLLRHPERVLGSSVESVSLNPENPQILRQQLRCAAHERALAPSELANFGETALPLVELMDREGDVSFRAGLFFYPSHEGPASSINIRGAGGPMVTLHVDGIAIGTMEKWRSMQQAHEGAVYLHRGASYVVTDLNLDTNTAIMESREVDYYTRADVSSVVEPQITIRERPDITLIGAKITSVVGGYRQHALENDAVLMNHELDFPPSTYETLAVRIDLPALPDEDPTIAIAGVHGIEHALMALAPLYAGCDRNDIGSAWYAIFPDTMRPAVFVYDVTPGGVGLCEKLWDNAPAWVNAARELVEGCDCLSGCPACLYSTRCGTNNDPLDKFDTIRQLGRLSEIAAG